MIGNDVIDLQLAAVQSDWQRAGFRDKVFTEGENCIIDRSTNASQMAWRLWSMKESGYKAYMRFCPKRFFNPKKSECIIAADGIGEVRIGTQRFQTKSTFEDDLICTTAYIEEIEQVTSETFLIPHAADESFFCHKKLINHFAKYGSVSPEDLRIEKTEQGVPYLTCDSEQVRAISISHHGRFGAFVILG